MASKIIINLDTSKENYLVAKCKQNDDLTLEASIFENGEALSLTNKVVTIQALKANNTYIIQNTNITKSNNKITVNLDRDFTRISGTTKVEIVLVESSKQNTTFSFYLEVVGSVIKGAVQSNNTVTILEDLEKKIVEAGVVKEETEQLIAEGGAATKGDVAEINASLEQITTVSDLEIELGQELVSQTGWVVGTGWSGSFANGFAHTTGNIAPLAYPISAIAGKLYQIDLMVDDADTMNSGFNFNVTIGNSEVFQMYKGTGATIRYIRGIQAIENGDLKIIPTTSFTGKIYNISVKEIIGKLEPKVLLKDGLQNSLLETRPTKAELNNVFIGKNVGQYNSNGDENTIIGNNAMPNNISGFWNSALGFEALKSNINGSRNIAIGRWSLMNNISGHRNIGVGTFSLHRVTTGAYNIGIGADSAWYTTSGSYNIAIGTVSLDKNTTGNQNIAIGYNALRDNEDTSNNVAIGHHTLRVNKSHNNTAIGSMAMAEATGNGATAIGYQALHKTTGINNTAIGQQSALALVSGNANTFIGRTSALTLVTGSDNTLIGQDSLRNMTEGSYNVAIGQGTGTTLTKGNNNILIGENTDVPSAETSNHLNIGKLLYGDLATRCIGIGISSPLARVHIGAGTTTVPPMRINSGVLLTTPMNGAIEFDGTDLYITTGTGVRKKITSVVV